MLQSFPSLPLACQCHCCCITSCCFHYSTISTTPSLGSREESLPIIPQLLYVTYVCGRMSSETRCQVLNIFCCNQSFQMWVIWLNSDVWMQKESPGGEWKNKIWQFFFKLIAICVFCIVVFCMCMCFSAHQYFLNMTSKRSAQVLA